jgi:hypothetical protein
VKPCAPHPSDTSDPMPAWTDPDWYKDLMDYCYRAPMKDDGGAPSPLTGARWIGLTQDMLDLGTFRILEDNSCVYLQEDIKFEPLGLNDYWPKFETSTPRQYPMGVYSLGFIAAITIEAHRVVLDLNGHTLEGTKEWQLKQRFWNAIQVSDRVFEPL